MEIYKPKKPESKKEPSNEVVYADQKAIDCKYAGIFGCRYPCYACKRNSVERLCCRTCELYKTCKNKCLATPLECQSKWDIPRRDGRERIYRIRGEELTLHEIADKYGLNYLTVRGRANLGMTDEELLGK